MMQQVQNVDSHWYKFLWKIWQHQYINILYIHTPNFFPSHVPYCQRTDLPVLLSKRSTFLTHMYASSIPLSFLELVPLPLWCLSHPSGPLYNLFHSPLSSFCQTTVHCALHAPCSKPVNIRMIHHTHTHPKELWSAFCSSGNCTLCMSWNYCGDKIG